MTIPRDHSPIRPFWLCRVEAHPWPCGTARLRPRRDYAGATVTLVIYMADRTGSPRRTPTYTLAGPVAARAVESGQPASSGSASSPS